MFDACIKCLIAQQWRVAAKNIKDNVLQFTIFNFNTLNNRREQKVHNTNSLSKPTIYIATMPVAMVSRKLTVNIDQATQCFTFHSK